MLHSVNILVGTLVAIIYCFIFWKLRNLGKYRIPLFVYAVVMQLTFLLSYAWTENSFRTDESFSYKYVDIYGDGITIFYFLMVVPFMVSVLIQTYREIWKLEVEKISKIIMITMFFLLCSIAFVIGLYVHVFFYYGFAP